MKNFGYMLKGRITQIYGNQFDFANALNARLESRGLKATVTKEKVSAWCQLTPDMFDAMSDVLHTDCRDFL